MTDASASWQEPFMATGWQLDTGLDHATLSGVVDGRVSIAGPAEDGRSWLRRTFDVGSGAFLGQEELHAPALGQRGQLGRLGQLDDDVDGLTLTSPDGKVDRFPLEGIQRISTRSLWSKELPIVALTWDEIVAVDIVDGKLRQRWRVPLGYEDLDWCRTDSFLWVAEEKLDDQTLFRAYAWNDGRVVHERTVGFALRGFGGTDAFLVAQRIMKNQRVAIVLEAPQLDVLAQLPMGERGDFCTDGIVCGDGFIAQPRVVAGKVDWALAPLAGLRHPRVVGTDAFFLEGSTLARIDVSSLKAGENPLELTPLRWALPQPYAPGARQWTPLPPVRSAVPRPTAAPEVSVEEALEKTLGALRSTAPNDDAVKQFAAIADARLMNDLGKLGLWFDADLESPLDWHFAADSDAWKELEKLAPFAKDESNYTHCFLGTGKIFTCYPKDEDFIIAKDFMTWLTAWVAERAELEETPLQIQRAKRALDRLRG